MVTAYASVGGEICVGKASLARSSVVKGDVTGTARTGTAIDLAAWARVDNCITTPTTGTPTPTPTPNPTRGKPCNCCSGLWTAGGSLSGVACINGTPVPTRLGVRITGSCDTDDFNDYINFCDIAARRATTAYQMLASLSPDRDYGNLEVSSYRRLELPRPGDFPGDVFPPHRTVIHMSSLHLGGAAKLVLNAATSPLTEIIVQVDGRLRLDPYSGLLTEGFGPEGLIFVTGGQEHRRVTIGTGARFTGTLVSFNRPISLWPYSAVEGAIIGGQRITLRRAAAIHYAPFTGQ